MLRELSHFHPDISNTVKLSVRDGENDLCFFRLDEKSFQTSPSISIDYAIIEKTKNLLDSMGIKYIDAPCEADMVHIL